MTVQRGRWFKSSYSPTNDDCVEVMVGCRDAEVPAGQVAIRDSKAPELGYFALSAASFRAFVEVARRV